MDVEAQEQIESEHAKWQAELRLFKGNLILDQKLIKNNGVWLPCTPRHPRVE